MITARIASIGQLALWPLLTLAILATPPGCQPASGQTLEDKNLPRGSHRAPQRLTADQEFRLRAHDALLDNPESSSEFQVAGSQHYTIGWSHPEQSLSWLVEVPAERVYDIWLTWSCRDEAAGDFFRIDSGDSRLIHRIPSTGGSENLRSAKFGSILLRRGEVTVTMRPLGRCRHELVHLQELRLVPTGHHKLEIPDGGLSPRATVASLQTPAHLEASLFVAEPYLTNPTSVAVDTYGRVWVTEASVYRYARGGGGTDETESEIPRIDRIKVFEDSNGDGRADTLSIFYEGLLAPLSLAVAGDRIFVAESPYLYVLEDRDHDLKADGPPRILLSGFGGFNDDQSLHGLALGPDHRLYMTQGDSGFDVHGPDGVHVRHDAGALLRCELDGTRLEVLAWDLKNPVEVAVNSFGEAWFSGNDDDGKRMCRLDEALDGGYYGWRGFEVYGRRLAALGTGAAAHWHADTPGVVPPVLITGFGAPSGQLFIEHDLWGSQYRNVLLQCDPGPRELKAFHLQHRGAGHQVRTEQFLTNEIDTYFRPVDAALAPDGSLLVCDWYDQGVGGHAYNDPNRGRIYRIQPRAGLPARREKPGPYRNDVDALMALRSPNLDTQYQARERLLASGQTAVGGLSLVLKDDDATLVARALWVLDRLGTRGRHLVFDQLANRNDELRALAVKILRGHLPESAADLLPLIHDHSPRVQRELLLALRQLDSPAADRALLHLVQNWNGSDRTFFEAAAIAVRGLSGQRSDRFPEAHAGYEMLRLADSRRAEWLFDHLVEPKGVIFDSRLVEWTRLLRPQDADGYLLIRLEREELEPGARSSILAGLGQTADESAGRRVTALLASEQTPDYLKRLVIGALQRHLGGGWSGLRDDDALKAALRETLANPELRGDALALIANRRLASLEPFVLSLAAQRTVLPAERSMAVAVAAQLGRPGTGQRLAALIDDDDLPPEVETAVFQSLVALVDGPALTALLKSPGISQPVKEGLVRDLGKTTLGALWLLQQVRSNGLEAPLRNRAVADGITHPDASVRTLFLDLVPLTERPRFLGTTVDRSEVLALSGNSQRGREVYATGRCSTCHVIDGRGGAIGPALGVIGRKYGREALLQSILEPSQSISPDYATSLIETKEGRILVGIAAAGDSSRPVLLRTATGDSLAIPQEQIISRTRQTVSLMPEQLAGSMTAQDLADLVAYMTTLTSETQLISDWWGLGVFGHDARHDFEHDFGPEADAGRIDFQARYRTVADREVRWEPVPVQPLGDSQGIDLQRFAADHEFRQSHLIAYFTTSIDAPRDESATLLLGSEDGIKVWLNGKLIHDHPVRRPPRFGDDEVPVNLLAGRNVLLVKLEHHGAGGGLICGVKSNSTLGFTKP